MNVDNYIHQKIINSEEYNIDEKIKLLREAQPPMSYTEIASSLHVGYSRISRVAKKHGLDSITTTTRRTSKGKSQKRHTILPKNAKESLSEEDMASLWSIYNTINRRRALSNKRLDIFFEILKKIEKN